MGNGDRRVEIPDGPAQLSDLCHIYYSSDSGDDGELTN